MANKNYVYLFKEGKKEMKSILVAGCQLGNDNIGLPVPAGLIIPRIRNDLADEIPQGWRSS